MSTIILRLLHNANISIEEISKKSHIPLDALVNATEEPIEFWTIRELNAFAESLKIKPSELLEELQPSTYILDINDNTQTIQGVNISNLESYYAIRAVVEAEHLEGWNPVAADITYLNNQFVNPDSEFIKDVESALNEYDVNTEE
ncbi:hypothetical protein [Lactobacillus intestinalis]|uniref:hypothetical protein n=1 Tax=Lactobacillus intestinalis TaxID=151781 RepID=UPI00242F6292|nr:hypothetical protein [Lactobacillus intestinalis]